MSRATPPPWAKRRVTFFIAAPVLVVFGLIILVTQSAGPARAALPASTALPAMSSIYAALANTQPTGLQLVSDPARDSELSTKGPIINAAPPPLGTANGPSAPLPATIRRLRLPLASVSAWIAESSNGGVCVLISPHTPIDGHYPVGVSCGSSINVTQGAFGELTDAGTPTATTVGVEPNGVTSVTVKLGNGATKILPVSDNAWALEADASVESSTQSVGR